MLSCVLGVSGLDDGKARRLRLRQSRAFALASLAVLRTLDVAFVVCQVHLHLPVGYSLTFWILARDLQLGC